MTDKTHFVLVSTARTGSNMVVSALAHHPNVVCFNELFNQEILWGYEPGTTAGVDPRLRALMERPDLAAMRDREPDRFLDAIYGHCYAEAISAVGFKLFYYHERNIFASEKLWPRIALDSDLKVIHLRRRDLLAAYYSQKIAERTGQWVMDAHNPYDVGQKRPLTVGVPGFLVTLGRIVAAEEDRISLLRNHPVLEIWYEDLVTDFRTVFERIETFLCVPHVAPRVATERQQRHPLPDVVVNFDEVRRAMIEAGLEDRAPKA